MDRSSLRNRLFFINSMLLNAVIALTILIQLVPDADTVKFIQSMYNIVLITFLLESLYFNLVFTGRSINTLLKTLLAGATFAVFLFFIFAGSDLFIITKQNSLWVYELVNHVFWFMLYSPLLVLIVYLILHALYRYSKSAKTNKERSQARVTMTAILISCSIGFVILMLMPLFNIFRIPLLTPYFFAVYLYGVFFAMVKYRFMSFSIKDISREILSQIHETVLILNTEQVVIESNSNPNELQTIDTSQFAGLKFRDITLPDESVSLMFNSLVAGEISSFRERIIYIGNPENIITDSSVSAVYDRFGDFSAILVVSRESRGISRFRKYYKLTEREIEIVLLTISGLSNIEISRQLSITKRTVETHQNNIYNKMGINNKIELLNVTSDFDIKAI